MNGRWTARMAIPDGCDAGTVSIQAEVPAAPTVFGHSANGTPTFRAKYNFATLATGSRKRIHISMA